MTPLRSAVAAGVLALVAVLAAVIATTSAGTSTGVASVLGQQGKTGAAAVKPAPGYGPLPALTAVSAWDNTAPLTDASLRGKVVLVDFWTASCINCRRTFGFLRDLQKTYASRGLVILGVHSPEFDFEKSHTYVTDSIRRLNVTWPVAEDPQMKVWNAFGNSYWPANYLTDRAGNVRYEHVGEGDEQQIEGAIRTLLAEGGSAGSQVVGQVPASERPPAAGEQITPETYLGTERPSPPGTVTLDPAAHQSPRWATLPGGVALTLRETARDVYALIGPESAGPVSVQVTLDGQPVPAALRGPDLTVDGQGRTLVRVTGQDLRHLLTGTAIGTHRLVLRPLPGGPALRIYTFTFGA
ncbi:MAG TPA: redoxin domain-containing protein [Mycobacteriales bacterium]|nr:redoxin domain-containing protein [Mycobacteriales bacterium]